MFKELFRVKSVDSILRESEKPEYSLKRALTAVDLTALGVGAIIGAGIFALTGTAAAGTVDPVTGEVLRPGAGPGLIVSFILTGIACGFCALCYAEFASLIPISGSAYTYAYATLGELVAWIIGWDLILEYAVGNIAVAVSWSGYFIELLRGLGLEIPPNWQWLTVSYNVGIHRPEIVAHAPKLFGVPLIVNLPAFGIVALLTVILVIGVKESARFNAIMVGVKLLVLVFFIIVGFVYVKPENWRPFAPNGWEGIMTGAALVFFAYIGFDAVSTTAEETKNPQRDLPLGMIGSLAICTILYVVTAAVLTGLISYKELGVAEPLALALRTLDLNWAAGIVAFGAVMATTSVLLVFQMGQPRIFFSMSRDGLLPARFASVHPRFKTPYLTTILTGIFVAVPAAFVDIGDAAELTNIGTLFAFVLVCAGVIILRHTDPERPRPFKAPLVPAVPLLGIFSCLYLMISLPRITWVRFGVWLAVGLLIYAWYGLSHSRLLEAQKRRGTLRMVLSGVSTIILGFVSLAASHHYQEALARATTSGATGQIQYARSMLTLTDMGFEAGVILGLLLVVTAIVLHRSRAET
ncbi:MAG TPA: amino acid permease [Blastocatellia bacterium]|nr:amino acid permease [Blastocatellia bacterium]